MPYQEHPRPPETEPAEVRLRALTPEDYVAFNEVAQSAWPGIKLFSEPIYVALTDQGVSTAAQEGNQLVGVSLNFLKPGSRRGEYAVYVHMIGTRQEQQGRGVGRQLMQHNYRLITEDLVGPGLTELKLTSDPLEAKNVLFYLHHLGMVADQYKLDAYKSLATGGAVQHRGLPADRLVYTARPAEAWATQRQLPTPPQYLQYLLGQPQAGLWFAEWQAGRQPDWAARGQEQATPPVLFVETPADLTTLKAADPELAQAWRRFHQHTLGTLLTPEVGYTAVDAVRLDQAGAPWHLLVLLRDFDHQQPAALQQAVTGTQL